MPPLSAPASLLAPEELCPALFLPALAEVPPLPALVSLLELQLAETNKTDGTSNNQPAFLIF